MKICAQPCTDHASICAIIGPLQALVDSIPEETHMSLCEEKQCADNTSGHAGGHSCMHASKDSALEEC